MLDDPSEEVKMKPDTPKVTRHVQTDYPSKDESTQTMGWIPSRVNLMGAEYNSTEQTLKTNEQMQPDGKVLTSYTTPVNRAHWNYPNGISKAYGERASVRFLKAMNVPVEAFYNENDEKDYKRMKATTDKLVKQREDRRKAMEKFQAMMRKKAELELYPPVSSSEPSDIEQE